jgi:hypothetical protein
LIIELPKVAIPGRRPQAARPKTTDKPENDFYNNDFIINTIQLSTMRKLYFWQIALFCLLSLAQTACKPTAGRYKTKDAERRILGIWEVKTLEKSGRIINITEIAGETFMEFYRFQKIEKDGKIKITYKYRMEMGGSDRMFDFKLVGDSIQFQQVKGWNDMKISSLDPITGDLTLDQAIDGDIISWALISRPDLAVEKEKEILEAAKATKKKTDKKK